ATMATLGAEVTVTDLKGNLPLLKRNSDKVSSGIQVEELTWGEQLSSTLQAPYDVVVGCDIMYIREAVPALISTLELLADKTTRIYLAYGRNRFAEELFFEGIEGIFFMKDIPESDFDEIYSAQDVRMVLLTKL
ncbi:hypothetical protein CYMTET_24888, partial [Cymbomonas tetramitiformis]